MVEKYWNTNPDMRFCQMLINLGVAEDNIDFWRFEDDELIKQLEEIEKKNESAKPKTKK